MDHLGDVDEIRADDVHFIDIGDTRHAVLCRLTPDRFGLRLNAALGAKDGDRAVEHTQRTLNLNGEVHVAGRVDDIDAVVAPEAVVAAEVIVMPRSCSCSIQSMVAAPSCTSPIL